jgi:hypothetical protein
MPTRLQALQRGPDILVDDDLVVVGRHTGCDARIASLRVSRMHCCLIEVGRTVLVRDLGSTNGVRINGRRTESGRLLPGDELSIAHFRYRLDGAPAARTIPADAPTGSNPGGQFLGDPFTADKGEREPL